MHRYRLGDDMLKRSSAEKELGAGGDSRLVMSQQCSFTSKRTNGVLEYVKKSTASRLTEVILPLYSVFTSRIPNFCQDQ